ncbi:toll/interleukin-1 receptor domain-containing protein [Mesorhizobium sp. B2-2-3]|uniref:toll/interleukin-1 receptor domain-containing protein n=1 Tax=Mesorhizobium sp. B2-2-3 TaxID=2589963 RepID=UPI0015E412D9|nr:toll/interleukin-1 receptor domain-containing protein [Mesorhizobium sp. B2-2-3]
MPTDAERISSGRIPEPGLTDSSEASRWLKYRAFISYSSSDRGAAEKLQKALESYKIPKPLRRSGKYLNGRVSPIFRDLSDLNASTDLGKTIRDALDNSEYLIVLCSPSAAASQWVEREISFFRGLGRPGNIIAVIVSGVPAAHDPLHEPLGAFPRGLVSLRDDDGSLVEPLAADIREQTGDHRGGDGFNLAKLKIVATMLGVSLAELTQRQAEADRRQRRVAQIVAAGMLFLAVLASGAAWIAWNQSLKAEQRLQLAVETAARQLGATAKYRDRYGVPTAVIQELLKSAERDFAGLISGDETSPMLVLQRARLNLEFSELYNLVGDDEHSQQKRISLIANSAADLDWLEQRSPSVPERIGLASAPDPAAIAMMRLKLYDAQAQERSYVGKFKEAIASAQSRIALSERWLSKTGELRWQRELAQGHCRIGSFNYQSGNLSASAAEYQKCLGTTRSLIEKRKDSSDRGDLMTALSELATTLVEMDRRSEALVVQREAADTVKLLVSAEKGNTEYDRTELITLTRLGDMVLSVDMNVGESLKLYEEALPISDKLTRSDSSRLDWQRDRSILLERLASAHLREADGADVTASLESLHKSDLNLQDALLIVNRLLNNDPLNREWLRDQSVIEERIGQVAFAIFKRGGDTLKLEDSERWYDKAIGDRRAILKEDPGSSIYKLDLAVGLIQLGEVAIQMPGRIDEAENSLKEALDLLKDLVKAKDALTIWRREIANAHYALANLYQRRGSASEARSEIQSALEVIRDLRKLYPDLAQYKQDEADLIAKKEELAKLQQ